VLSPPPANCTGWQPRNSGRVVSPEFPGFFREMLRAAGPVFMLGLLHIWRSGSSTANCMSGRRCSDVYGSSLNLALVKLDVRNAHNDPTPVDVIVTSIVAQIRENAVTVWADQREDGS